MLQIYRKSVNNKQIFKLFYRFYVFMTKEDINNRALQAIEWLLQNTDKLTKSALAESFSVKPAKFTEILKGRMFVGADMLAALCKTYGFSSEWLLTGTGDMFEIQNPQQLSEAEKRLIRPLHRK